MAKALISKVGAAAAVFAAFVVPSAAFAARSIGDLTEHWGEQGTQVISFITVLCYGFAFFLAFIGGKMLWDKNKNQSAADPEAGKRILAAFAGAVVLVAIPEALGTGVMTVFGSTSNLSSATPTVPQIR